MAIDTFGPKLAPHGEASAPGDSAIVGFYRGGRDARGRTRGQILAWDDARLEAVHDYIQWLFPLPEASAFSQDAPRLTAADIAAFRRDPVLTAALRASLHRMLAFYRLADRADPPRRWLTPGNHNFLRITRILRSLHLLGLEDEAAALLARLEVLALDRAAAAIIGPRTLAFWRDARSANRA